MMYLKFLQSFPDQLQNEIFLHVDECRADTEKEGLFDKCDVTERSAA